MPLIKLCTISTASCFTTSTVEKSCSGSLISDRYSNARENKAIEGHASSHQGEVIALKERVRGIDSTAEDPIAVAVRCVLSCKAINPQIDPALAIIKATHKFFYYIREQQHNLFSTYLKQNKNLFTKQFAAILIQAMALSPYRLLLNEQEQSRLNIRGQVANLALDSINAREFTDLAWVLYRILERMRTIVIINFTTKSRVQPSPRSRLAQRLRCSRKEPTQEGWLTLGMSWRNPQHSHQVFHYPITFILGETTESSLTSFDRMEETLMRATTVYGDVERAIATRAIAEISDQALYSLMNLLTADYNLYEKVDSIKDKSNRLNRLSASNRRFSHYFIQNLYESRAPMRSEFVPIQEITTRQIRDRVIFGARQVPSYGNNLYELKLLFLVLQDPLKAVTKWDKRAEFMKISHMLWEHDKSKNHYG